MKLTRKLIPAMIMLLVSAVLMSTASFAWFAMNTEVTATGMEVTAKAGDIFLEIKGTEDGETWKTIGTNAVDAELYPVAHEESITAAELDTASKWFYYYSDDINNHEKADGATKDTVSVFADYVAKTSYTVRLNSNMVTTAYDLYVSEVTLPANTGITLIVKCGEKFKEFKNGGTFNWTADTDNIADTMSDSELTVDVYLYIDGENANVKTSNVAALTGAVSFKLSASAAQRVATP